MDRPRTGGGTTALRTAMCRTSWGYPRHHVRTGQRAGPFAVRGRATGDGGREPTDRVIAVLRDVNEVGRGAGLIRRDGADESHVVATDE